MLSENYVVEIPGSCSLKISKPTETFTILKCFRLPTVFFKKDIHRQDFMTFIR